MRVAVASAASLLAAAVAFTPTSLSAQTWGQGGVTIHQFSSPFNLVGWHAMNNRGEMAVTMFTPTGAKTGVLSLDGTFTEYIDLGFTTARADAKGLNDSGVVAGDYTPATFDGRPQGFVQGAGDAGPTLIGSPGTSGIEDINNSGQAAGWIDGRAALWVGGTPIYLSDGISRAFAVNDAGVATGTTRTASGNVQATIFANGEEQHLDMLGGVDGQGMGINNAGDVVGQIAYGTSTNRVARAFVYRDGVMTDLGTLGSTGSVAYNIDDYGRVVGAGVGFGDRSALLWEDNGESYAGYRLDDIVGDDDWNFLAARNISDDGRFISVYAENLATGYNNWVVLEDNTVPATVTPEPVSMILMGTGLAGIGALRRRKKKNLESAI